MAKFISTVEPIHRVGQVNEEIVGDARHAGLSEAGVEAMTKGDKIRFKKELDALARVNPGSVWACSSGYALWFNSATPAELRHEEQALERGLRCLRR